MEEINRQLEAKESIEVELTAKGKYKWTIKCRDEVISETTVDRIEKADKELKATFPNNVTTGE